MISGFFLTPREKAINFLSTPPEKMQFKIYNNVTQAVSTRAFPPWLWAGKELKKY